MIELNNIDKLQKSPYLIAFPNRDNNKIDVDNFLTDKIFSIDKEYFKKIKNLIGPINTKQLILEYGIETIYDMFNKGFLVDSETIWGKTNIKYLQVETTTHCNWRCEYCPVSIDPKGKKTMSVDSFNSIIDKACKCPSIRFVSIIAYNEPTLDVYFEERIKKIAKSNLKLTLFTNGSMLNNSKIKLLKELDVVEYIQFNLPSVDEDKFRDMTGSPLYKQTIENIEQALSYGFKTMFAIKGTKEEQLVSMDMIKERFRPVMHDNVSFSFWTTDRAGMLKNKYAKNINIRGPLLGCKRVINWMNVGINGDCYICCEDYYEKEIYGNILESEIDDILNSQKSQLIRKQVFGNNEAPDDFICRKCYRMYESKVNTRLLGSKRID